jgi:hypothetical protein
VPETDHPTPHDRLFKTIFSQAENALGLFRTVLPSRLVDAIDPATVHVEPGSFVDAELSEVHRDLLFSARLREREVLLYVLVEHQSSVDPLMPLRLLRYVVRVWEAWFREHPDARRIPAVIPLVVHQGAQPWNGPRRLSEIIDLPPELAAAVERHVPALELALEDLGSVSAEALAALRAPPVARFALVLLRSAAERADFAVVLSRSHDLMRAIYLGSRGAETLGTLLRYTLLVGRMEKKVLREHIQDVFGEEADEVFASEWCNDLINKGRRQGVKQGIEQGHRAILERLLRARFGDLDDATRSRLAKARATDLTRWAERVLTARRLADVFTLPRKGRRRR